MAILHAAFFYVGETGKEKSKGGSSIKKLKGDKHLTTWQLALSYNVLALLLSQYLFFYFYMFLHCFVIRFFIINQSVIQVCSA